MKIFSGTFASAINIAAFSAIASNCTPLEQQPQLQASGLLLGYNPPPPELGTSSTNAQPNSTSTPQCSDAWMQQYGNGVDMTPTSGDRGTVPQILKHVNEARSLRCLCGDKLFEPTSPLRWNDKLTTAAMDHSAYMARQRVLSHTGQGGSSSGDRVTKAGYSFLMTGENVALGYDNVQMAVFRWLKSAGHCKNIMEPNFQEIGVAYVKGMYPDTPDYADQNRAGFKPYYWSMELGTPK